MSTNGTRRHANSIHRRGYPTSYSNLRNPLLYTVQENGVWVFIGPCLFSRSAFFKSYGIDYLKHKMILTTSHLKMMYSRSSIQGPANFWRQYLRLVFEDSVAGSCERCVAKALTSRYCSASFKSNSYPRLIVQSMTKLSNPLPTTMMK